MTPARAIACGVGSDRRVRNRSRSGETRLRVEIRWSVASAALGSSAAGDPRSDDCELLARVGVRSAASGAADGSLSLAWTGRSPDPSVADGWYESRPLTGRVAEERAGWIALRLSDGRGLELDLVVRRPLRRHRGAGGSRPSRVAYLRTNLPALLGLPGGRYSTPAMRLPARENG